MNASATISSSEQRDIENEIMSGRWDAIRRRLCSGAATRSFCTAYRNENGMNAFCLLCANNDAPPDVVQKMASVDKAYLWAKTPVRDHVGGASAIHFAAETGSTSTIKILLDRMCNVRPWNVDRGNRTWLDDEDRTPLDILLESRLAPNYLMYSGEEREGNDVQSITSFLKHITTMTCYTDMKAEMQDLWEKTNCFIHAALALTSSTQGHVLPGGKQWLLIHEIVKRGGESGILLPRDVLLLAGKIYPEFLKMRDENGDLPLHIAFASPQFWGCGVLEFSIDKIVEEEEDDAFYDQFESLPCEERTSDRVLLQMFPGAAALKNKNGKLPLHVLCDNMMSPMAMWRLMPRHIDYLVQANPGAFLAPDNSGCLPLHILFKCLSGCLSRCDHCIGDRRQKFFSSLPHHGNRTITMALIEFSPRKALQVGDKVGRLPLHLLLDRGTPIRQTKTLDPHGTPQYFVVPDTDMVDALVEKAPDTLDVPDPKTHLFPFMMAAVGKNSAIDCIYSLLRKSPVNVKSGIVHTRYEKYLLQKMDDMKNNTDRERMNLSTEIESLKKEIADLRSCNKKRKLGS